MQQDLAERIANDPEFQRLIQRRTAYGWRMALIMMAAYFAFILVIAYAPGFFATKVAAGSPLSLGITIGFVLIVFAFVLTGLYVHKANTVFDAATRKIQEAHQ
ncbi:DUF485 domain-containing protein [Halothiobacillus sp. DCM-1]|uniref:DUF485 domain-containing protein n=1 Tax=Halothiobacillus sp. DCM-1 TaxID=3112558 RepID=UPI00324B764E